MKKTWKTILAVLVATCAVLVQAEAQGLKVGDKAPGFTLMDSNGEERSLSDFEGKYVVLEWTNFGCPFVKKFYSNGDMQALQEKYTGKEVVWLSICSSAPGKQGYCDQEEAADVVAEKELAGTAYLMDSEGKVGKSYGAKTTPHIFIVGPDQSLVYQGAIDSIRSTSSADIAKAENYVSKTLEAAMAGQAVDPASTQAYGCGIKY